MHDQKEANSIEVTKSDDMKLKQVPPNETWNKSKRVQVNLTKTKSNQKQLLMITQDEIPPKLT